MDYYTLRDDIGYRDRWYLGNINVEDNWVFTDGTSVNLNKFGNLSIEVDQGGIELDFTETDGYIVPIVSESFAELLFEYGEFIQLIPISIQKSRSNYYILVIKNLIDCVDEQNSDFRKFLEGNDIRPDRVGEYEVINILKVDTTKINVPIFRLAKYEIKIIVDENIKKKLENANLRGFKFKLVS